jgi:hypothetical protein
MTARTLGKLILSTLAASSLGGGQAACSDCTETTFDDSADFVLSPLSGDSAASHGPFGVVLQTIQYASSDPLGDAATAEPASSFTSLDGSDLYSNAGVSFAIDDAGSYDEWRAALVNRPCIDTCNQLIPLSGYGGGSSTATSCAPPAEEVAPYGEGAVVVVHCEWTEVDCVHSGNGAGNESDSGGCSLGRGRVPPGFVPRAVVGKDPRARFFASAAQLEAASIGSFEIVARDLRAHGAPARLVRAALRARKDEIRHARVMSRLAREHGATTVPRVAAARWAPRNLEAIATENAVEGCVRETYGAIDATWMAESARDPRVRAEMRVIARDETRHAALAWQVHAWSSARLDPAARARIARAREVAVRELSLELAIPQSSILASDGLVPSAQQRISMLFSLERRLGRAAASWFFGVPTHRFGAPPPKRSRFPAVT